MSGANNSDPVNNPQIWEYREELFSRLRMVSTKHIPMRVVYQNWQLNQDLNKAHKEIEELKKNKCGLTCLTLRQQVKDFEDKQLV